MAQNKNETPLDVLLGFEADYQKKRQDLVTKVSAEFAGHMVSTATLFDGLKDKVTPAELFANAEVVTSLARMGLIVKPVKGKGGGVRRPAPSDDELFAFLGSNEYGIKELVEKFGQSVRNKVKALVASKKMKVRTDGIKKLYKK